MLREGKTYLEIAEKTGASTATISRVNRSLNYGSDGYDMVFERLLGGEESKKNASERGEKPKTGNSKGTCRICVCCRSLLLPKVIAKDHQKDHRKFC